MLALFERATTISLYCSVLKRNKRYFGFTMLLTGLHLMTNPQNTNGSSSYTWTSEGKPTPSYFTDDLTKSRSLSFSLCFSISVSVILTLPKFSLSTYPRLNTSLILTNFVPLPTCSLEKFTPFLKSSHISSSLTISQDGSILKAGL